MKTYKIKQIIVSTILVISLWGCELDRYPYDALTDEAIEGDKETSLPILLNGCYAQLKDWSDVVHRIGEYPGDNIAIRGTSTDDFFPFISYAHYPNNYRLDQLWDNSYKIISQASDIINKRAVPGESPEIDQSLGEAYFLRGMCYFYLCRAFGRPYWDNPQTNLGVPIVNGLPENLQDLQLPDRSTVEQTYRQAISDLRQSANLMSFNKSPAYASREVAYAILSRVYLYMGGTYEAPNTIYNDSAIYYADLVINSGRYNLLPTETFKRYNELSPEDASQTETIMAVKFTLADNVGSFYYYTIGSMYATVDGQGWGEMYASESYLELLRESKKDDARRYFIEPQYEDDITVFRVVVETKDKSGNLSGYKYMQPQVDATETKVNIDGATYTITVTDALLKQYSISYEGKLYYGYLDKTMILNRANPMFYVYKCSKQDGGAQLHSPIIARLAEMHLNKAEASAKNGDNGTALAELNIIRERSIPGGALTTLSPDAKTAIQNERRLELAFEGHRAFDIYRNGETLVRRYPGAHNMLEEIPATHKRVVHYIPQKEINAYPSTLTQNP